MTDPTARRVHPRYVRRLRAFLSIDGAEHAVVTKNLSLGGMFLITDAAIAYPAMGFLRIKLPALREESTLPVQVTWRNDDGVGVQYESLRAIEVWALNQLFKESPPAP